MMCTRRTCMLKILKYIYKTFSTTALAFHVVGVCGSDIKYKDITDWVNK